MKRPAALLALLLAGHAGAEEEKLPLGIEVVTGFRSDYVHRGFQLAGSLIDIQAEAEIALGDRWLLNVGGYHGTATGDGDFSESAAFLDLRFEADAWTAAFAVTWRDYQDALFTDGFDLSPSFTWHLNDDWDLGTGFAYDTGDGGWYGFVEASWSKPTSESSFLSAKAGSSWTADYYGSDGWHDLYSRLSWTYAINRNVAITPFIGAHLPTSSGPEQTRLYAGVWFEVNF